MTTTEALKLDAMADQAPRKRRWVPGSLRIFAVALVLLMTASVASIWWPYRREKIARQQVEEWGGWTNSEWAEPTWLDWMPAYVKQQTREQKIFDRIAGIGLNALARVNSTYHIR